MQKIQETMRRPFVERLSTNLLIRLASSRMIDGLWVGADDGAEQDLDRVAAALQLIKTHDPRRYDRILRDLDRIWVRLLYGNAAQYNAVLNACEIDTRFVLDEETTLELIAAVIVHEATHARLEKNGIVYDEPMRERIEAVCVRRELSFARKLPNGAQIEAWSKCRLDPPLDLTNAAFEKRKVEGMIATARYVGMPEWLLQGTLAVRRFAVRLSNARRRTLQNSSQAQS